MSIKPTLPFVETMITQACNISCLGCTNYSDLKHNGYVSWREGKKQIEAWLDRINIPDFGIMGGEPLINPEVKEWIKGCRELLPNAQIRFTTNGILLSKHFDIIDLMADIGNCVFKITVHTESAIVQELIDKILSKYTWSPVVEHGINRFKTDNNLRFQISRPVRFVKTYQNSYNNMLPYNNDPVSAFDNCCQQTCPLLYNGNIYKCSTSGLLKGVLERFNYPNKDSWDPYITNGISPDCDNIELQKFIDNFGKPHSLLCGQCPTANDSNIVHLENVYTKNAQFNF
jgi:organic radical activating enzyme